MSHRSGILPGADALTVILTDSNRWQVLQPWRRVFRDAFALDEAAGALASLRSPRAAGKQPLGITQLGERCQERVPDYEAMLPIVCEALELPKRIARAAKPAPSSDQTSAAAQVSLLHMTVAMSNVITSCVVAARMRPCCRSPCRHQRQSLMR